MTVAFITDDWAFDKMNRAWIPNGSAFYRSFLPFTVIPGSVMGRPRFNPVDGFGVDTDDGYGRYGFDTVVLKLLAYKQAVRQVEKAKEIGQRIVVDVDDYAPGIHPANISYVHLDAEADKAVNWSHHERIVELADTVIVSTPFLERYYRQHVEHPDVRLVRNGVDMAMFRPYARQHEKKPALGWVGSLGWRSEDLETLRGWIGPYCDKYGLRFHHGGYVPKFGTAHERLGIRRELCSVQPMVPIVRLGVLMDFDIGIVPLNDIDFNHAKSFLKGIEYAACRIPFVAQRLPEYTLLESYGIGVTAQTDEEWVEALDRLRPLKAREEAAERAYEAVASHHTIEHRADAWRAAVSLP